MIAYADTGFLCSLYAPDAHTEHAASRMIKQGLPLPIIWLHRLELRNAMRLRVFRKEISPIQRDASLNSMLTDLASGVFESVEIDVSDLASEAERLSTMHSESLGVRSLDILHVAAALVLGVPAFLTFNRRQHALAKAIGLKAPKLLA
jgi:hypothetical protein